MSVRQYQKRGDRHGREMEKDTLDAHGIRAAKDIANVTTPC
jgi:hypothetical protein